MKNWCFGVMLGFVVVFGVSAQQMNDVLETSSSHEIDKEATANAQWKAGEIVARGKTSRCQKASQNDGCEVYRQFIGVDNMGHYLVQDFYVDGNVKRTDPFSLVDSSRVRSDFDYSNNFFAEMLNDKKTLHVSGNFVAWFENGQKMQEHRSLIDVGVLKEVESRWDSQGSKTEEVAYANGQRVGTYEASKNGGRLNFVLSGLAHGKLWKTLPYGITHLMITGVKEEERWEFGGVVATGSGGCFLGVNSSFSAKCDFYRKLLGANELGHYLVQDFFSDGDVKRTEPYWIKRASYVPTMDFSYSLTIPIVGSFSLWLKNGELEQQRNYPLSGSEQSVHVTYFMNGKQTEEGYFKNGAREGAWSIYESDGFRSEELFYERGVLDQTRTRRWIRNEGLSSVKASLSHNEAKLTPGQVVLTDSIDCEVNGQLMSRYCSAMRLFLGKTPEGYYWVQDYIKTPEGEEFVIYTNPYVLRSEKAIVTVLGKTFDVDPIDFVGEYVGWHLNGEPRKRWRVGGWE